ncbi:MAG: AI-2E family transporter [Clostridia bacterium]|nr:AI-2E family transporter [Clostridia bacterium]
MNFNKKNIKTIILILFSAILFMWLLENIAGVGKALGGLWSMLTPFIVGAAIAFIFNVPMRGIENLIFKKESKFRRPLSYVITLVVVFGVITFALYVIIPQLADTMVALSKQIPPAIAALGDWYNAKIASIDAVKNFTFDFSDVSKDMVDFLKDGSASLISSGFGLITGIISGIISFVIGFIFSVYILMQKESLAVQGKKIIYALFKEERADRIMEVLKLTNTTFSRFISGQCVEAIIIWVIFFCFMSIFKFPYAMLISMTIGIFSLVPMIGALTAAIIGALLICIQSPLMALLFLVMYVVLQQVEGNLIYPHVVGNAVKLPSIWVLFGAIMGAKLGGLVPMLIAIPLFSVIYALFRTYVYDRLEARKVPAEKYD